MTYAPTTQTLTRPTTRFFITKRDKNHGSLHAPESTLEAVGMGNLNITLDGFPGMVIDAMLKKGLAKTKTEAIRLALFDFEKRHWVMEEDDVFGYAAAHMMKQIDSGREKTHSMTLDEMKHYIETHAKRPIHQKRRRT